MNGYREEMKPESNPHWQRYLDRPGTWHSHGENGFYEFVWNEETKRWECAGCGEPWAA